MQYLKPFFILVAFLSCAFPVQGQTNLEFQSQFEWENTGANDIWGFSNNGREYALVGLFRGLSVVDVTTPDSPVELYHIERPSSTWRDLKEYNGYVYAVDDQEGGQLVIIDCTDVGNISHTYWTTDELGDFPFTTCHNIFIDEFGIAYLFGCNNLEQTNRRGALMLDLNSNPLNPNVVGQYTDQYVHDGYVRDNILWASQIFDGSQAAIDVSDKSNPVVLATWNTPGFFTHNCWLNDEGNILFTTDEQAGQYVAAYDVSDLSDVRELDRIRSNPGSFIIPHNAFTVGDHVVVSYYTDGVIIIDATKPDNLVIVGQYDTAPDFSAGTFDGCWGVYPYLPSGNIIASDQQTGLWVLEPTYAKAGYLEGTITDSSTGAEINGVTVEVLNSDMQDESNFVGEYKTGTANYGAYTVLYKKEGYEDFMAENVIIEETNTTILNVKMTPQVPFNMEVKIVDAQGIPLPFAEVSAVNEYGQTSAFADENAIALFEGIFENDYSLVAGQWGYITTGVAIPVSSENNSVSLTLQPGYYDDFIFNFGWELTSTSEAGNWEWADPIGYSSNTGLPFEPTNDVSSDFGTYCLVTDSRTGFAGPDDVDDGETIIQSPIFDLSAYEIPTVSFHRWFANGGGQGTPPNDMLQIFITNGIETVLLDQAEFGDDDLFQWKMQTYALKDFIEVNDQMRLIIQTGDTEEFGHLVEAGFDLFKVVDAVNAATASSIDDVPNQFFEVIPNPIQESFQLPDFGDQPSYFIYSVNGELLSTGRHQTVDCSELSTGVYLIQVTSQDGQRNIAKFVKE